MAGGDAAGVSGTKGWEQAASRLKGARPGRELDERCRALVDELERVADPEKAGQMLSGLLAGLGHAARSRVLDESIERIYVTPGNCGALESLFGEIGKALDGDRRTYALLDAVRASLLCAHARTGELGDSAGGVLDSCYGVLAGVARDNKLEELSALMGRADARDVTCGGAGGIARLWRLVYDMCDIPNGTEINCALGRYGRLRSLSSKARLRGARGRISQLLLHIATDHIMHEDYEVIYNVARESNMRIRYWLEEIYRQHGVSNDPHLMDRPAESVFYGPSTGWIHLAMACKYLILELKGFASWERVAYRMIVKRLNFTSPDVIYKIIERRDEMNESIGYLRNTFGAHIDLSFNEAKAKIDEIGLATLVRHARKVLMFQDSAYRGVIPHKYYSSDPWSRELVEFDPPQGDPDKIRAIKEKYGPVDIKLQTQYDKWDAMHGSYLCLYLLYGKYLERIHGDSSTLEGIMRATSEIYNIKYMILELANITKELADAGLDMPFEPEFASRQKEYWCLRGAYAAHLRTGEIKCMMQVMGDKRELLSHIPHDIEELGQVVAKLEGEFPEARTYEIDHMTGPEMDDIEAELNTLRESTHAALGNRFLDPHEEQRRRDAMERFKSKHGLEGGGSRRAQAGHGAEEARNPEGQTPESPLRAAEGAIAAIGLQNCPKEWADDLVCGDHAGALARMRAYATLSAGGGAEAAPGCPAGCEGGPDMAAETKDGRLWLSVCSLDNVPRLLGAVGHVPGAGRAIAADILEAARARLGGMGACRDQVALVAMDPDGAIGDHGGLEAALESIGREMPWVGAVAIVRESGCEVRGMPRARTPLGEQARATLRALGAAGRRSGQPTGAG